MSWTLHSSRLPGSSSPSRLSGFEGFYEEILQYFYYVIFLFYIAEENFFDIDHSGKLYKNAHTVSSRLKCRRWEFNSLSCKWCEVHGSPATCRAVGALASPGASEGLARAPAGPQTVGWPSPAPAAAPAPHVQGLIRALLC